MAAPLNGPAAGCGDGIAGGTLRRENPHRGTAKKLRVEAVSDDGDEA
jgi:hypothetical protein